MTFLKNQYKTLLIGSISLALSACANVAGPTVGGGNVSYGDAKAVETVDVNFGSTDLQMVAETMTKSLIQSPILRNRPMLVISEVKNKTGEYIDTRAITDSVRTQLLKSGTVRFANDKSNRDSTIDELEFQNSGLVNKSKAKKVGKMKAADYVLAGNVVSIVKRSGSIHDVYYKFSLILSDIEGGEIVWADEKEIRKTARR